MPKGRALALVKLGPRRPIVCAAVLAVLPVLAVKDAPLAAPAAVAPPEREAFDGDLGVIHPLSDGASLEGDLVFDSDDPLASREAEPPPVASMAPRVLFLWYADGTPRPRMETNQRTCPGTPPPFRCGFGGAEGIPGCQKAVQRYLDQWYADFNLVVTLTKPTSGRVRVADSKGMVDRSRGLGTGFLVGGIRWLADPAVQFCPTAGNLADPREIGTPEPGLGQIPGLLATREDLPGRDGGTGPAVYADSSRGSVAKAWAAAFGLRGPGLVK